MLDLDQIREEFTLVGGQLHRDGVPVIGSLSGCGYMTIRWQGRREYVHRIVAALKLDRAPEPGEVTHHLDLNPLNNRADNVAFVSPRENALHARMLARNAVGYTGVSPSRDGFTAYITIFGKRRERWFPTFAEARAQRDAWAEEFGYPPRLGRASFRQILRRSNPRGLVGLDFHEWAEGRIPE